MTAKSAQSICLIEMVVVETLTANLKLTDAPKQESSHWLLYFKNTLLDFFHLL